MVCDFSDIAITPVRLDFEVEEGSRFEPPSQRLSIKQVRTTRESVLAPDWRVAVVKFDLETTDWVRARPTSGRGEKDIKVSTKSKGLPGRQYVAQARVTSSIADITITPSVIPIRLTVRAKAPIAPPEPPPMIYGCSYCIHTFNTEEELARHIKQEHPTKPLPKPKPKLPKPPKPTPEPGNVWAKLIKMILDFLLRR